MVDKKIDWDDPNWGGRVHISDSYIEDVKDEGNEE